MTPDTLARFRQFLIDCGEGCLDFLYLDTKCIPTTAIGCAVFTLVEMLSIDWRNPDQSPASQMAIQGAWTAVRSHPEMAKGGGVAFGRLTSIRLGPGAADALLAQRVARFEAELRPSLPTYSSAPDAAQEGACRLAYATGADGFARRWPKFAAAFNVQDWAACAQQCRIPELDGPEPKANPLEAALFESLT